jgi:hypothetical protein
MVEEPEHWLKPDKSAICLLQPPVPDAAKECYLYVT